MVVSLEVARHFLAEQLGWNPLSIIQGKRNRSRHDPDPSDWEPLPDLADLVCEVEGRLTPPILCRYELALRFAREALSVGDAEFVPHGLRANVLVALLQNHVLRCKVARQIKLYRRGIQGLPTVLDAHGRLNPSFCRAAVFALRNTVSLQTPETEKVPRVKDELFGLGKLLLYPKSMFLPRKSEKTPE